MVRNVLGSLLALLGAAAAVWSPFRAWYGGRHGSDIRVDDLFTGVGATSAGAALLGSLFLPFAFAALLTLLGVLLRSRVVVGSAGVLVVGFTVLWMIRQGQSDGSLTLGGDGLAVGVALAVGGGVLTVVGATLMSGPFVTYGEPAPQHETLVPAAYPADGSLADGYPAAAYPADGYPAEGSPAGAYPAGGYAAGAYTDDAYTAGGPPAYRYPPAGDSLEQAPQGEPQLREDGAQDGFPDEHFPDGGYAPEQPPAHDTTPYGVVADRPATSKLQEGDDTTPLPVLRPDGSPVTEELPKP